MNYINLKTKRIVTPAILKMQTGIDEWNRESALKAGYGYVEYQYPEFDSAYYTMQPKAELTKMEGQEGRFVQEFDLVPKLLDEVAAVIKAKVTDKRWEKETGGITLPNGVKVLTGIADQNRVSTSIQGMTEAKIDSIDFKAESGWVKLTLDELKAISVAMTHHVEQCFARECVLHKMCDAAESIAELKRIMEEEIDKGWPEYA